MIDFSQAECRREFSFYFSKCQLPYPTSTLLDANSIPYTVTGFTETGTGGGLGTQTDYFTCEMAWTFLNLPVTGPVLPNYSTGGPAFIQTMWDTLMTTYPKEDWYPHVYCSKD
jgi:hypothetical protein